VLTNFRTNNDKKIEWYKEKNELKENKISIPKKNEHSKFQQTVLKWRSSCTLCFTGLTKNQKINVYWKVRVTGQ
jgi:hypothetical protein